MLDEVYKQLLSERVKLMKQNRLTERENWENYWDKLELPAKIKKTKKSLYLNEILKIFDRFLPQNDNLSILEIGGAPGQYLAYMSNNFHYKIYALDYSDIGCRKMKENFSLLGLKGIVYQKDLFSDDISDLPLFDIVYSLGFIEHFQDLDRVIDKHLELLKPGGILLIGTPNFLGVNHWVLRRLAPQRLAQHNLSSMDIRNWSNFEKRFNLRVIFKGYIGGFEPSIYRCGNRTLLNRFIYMLFIGIRIIITDNLKFLRKFNYKYWSGYVIGVYRKSEQR